VSEVYILWWENEDGDWDFVGAYPTREAAGEALGREQGWDPEGDYSITPLILKESK
jgi:hypothetical protein